MTELPYRVYSFDVGRTTSYTYTDKDPQPLQSSCGHYGSGLVTLKSGRSFCKRCYVELTTKRNQDFSGRYGRLRWLKRRLGQLPELRWVEVKVLSYLVEHGPRAKRRIKEGANLRWLDLEWALQELERKGLIADASRSPVRLVARSRASPRKDP